MKHPKNKLLRPFFLLIVASLFAFGISKVVAEYQLIPGVDMKVFNPLQALLAEKEESSPVLIPEEVEHEVPEDNETVVDSALLIKEQKMRELAELRARADKLSNGLTDYSAGEEALLKFQLALSEAGTRQVRIAFLGDSFIEGDILVGPFRNELQAKYGGKGVGYVPMTSETARFRTTVKHRFKGKWQKLSSLRPKKGSRFTLAENFDIASKGAEVSFEMTKSPSNLASVDRVLFLYQSDSLSSYTISINGSEPLSYTANYDTILPARLYGEIFEQSGVKEVTLTFPDGFNGRLHGIYLDGNTGVVVDNYSLRGSSGLQLAQVSSSLTNDLSRLRDYDLIILSYGLNVASGKLEDPDDYGWYYSGMAKSIEHLQRLYPNAVFLMMSISDRATLDEGKIITLPSVSKILLHQKRLAEKYGCLFWNTYGIMQEQGGIEGFVNKGWAAKDYTHLSYAGGQSLAKALLQDLLP